MKKGNNRKKSDETFLIHKNNAKSSKKNEKLILDPLSSHAYLVRSSSLHSLAVAETDLFTSKDNLPVSIYDQIISRKGSKY